MAIARDASSPAAVYQDTASAAAITTASFTPPNGSIIVAKGTFDDGSNLTGPSITGTVLTWTSRVNHIAASHTPVFIYTAVGTGVAVTVSLNQGSTGTNRKGLVVSVWTGAQLAASPATNVLDQGTSVAPSSTLTTAAANSVVDWLSADWAAVDGTTRTYRSSATEQSYHNAGIGTAYAVYFAHQSAGAAGSQIYGLTAPTGQTPSLAAIEIQDSGSAPAIPPFLTMQTRRSY